MTDQTHTTANGRLKSILERLERLAEDRAAIDTDYAAVLAEAKGEGFDVKIIKALLKKRAGDTAAQQEEAALLDLYERAVA